jgi:ubiquinone/menaquinone biosynthesis C-methylase UbiE
MNDDYFIGVHARELERLKDQHAAWEPETRALWQRAGFGVGQHIADLGSGPGFSAFDLAQTVTPSGRVTALDKAAPFVGFLSAEAKRRGLANIDAVVADITHADALGAPLDGAFCRFFLAFLIADLDAVLARIHRSLKPGGVFAAMEYLTLDSTTSSPPMRGFDAHTRAWQRYYLAHGGDTEVGRSLPRKLAAAGFSVVDEQCVGGVAGPSHRRWNWWGRLVDDFGEKLAADALMSIDELRNLRNDWSEASRQPDAFIHTPLLLQVVARRD